MSDKFYPKLFQAVLEEGLPYKNDESSAEYKVVKRTLNWMLREYKGSYKLYASEEAKKRAEEMNLKSLDQYSWKSQVIPKDKGGMGDNGRNLFYREHLHPIAQIIKELMTLDPKNLNEIEKVLGKISIAWITKEQQKCLDKDGGKCKRGDNPIDFCQEKLQDKLVFLKNETKDIAFED